MLVLVQDGALVDAGKPEWLRCEWSLECMVLRVTDGIRNGVMDVNQLQVC